MSEDLTTHFREHGYAICRGVFSPEEMAEIHAATERVRERVISGDGACGNAKFYCTDGMARSATWCAIHEPLLASVRTDSRMLALIEPLLGNTVRQLINNLHWKPPGSDFSVAFHNDRVNRERGQGEAIRNLPDCYVQTGLAVDPMQADNGPLILIRGSHRNPDRAPIPSSVYADGTINEEQLLASGYTPDEIVTLHLNPGDIAFWSPDTLHGSSVNRHPHLNRCFYINGYVDARDCFLGYWAWIDGEPVPLPGKDVPVHVYGKQDFASFELS